MADIQSLLRQLLSAVYGKDVRQAIHDAIHQCYADGKAGSVDLVARENIDLANKRIDNLAKLGEGSTTGDAELQDVRVGADGTVHDSAGAAVRAQISELKGDIEQLKQGGGTGSGTGLSTEAIDKLEEVGNYLAYTTADGGSKWTELISILRNGSSGGGSGDGETTQKTLSSISATYTGGDVAAGTALSDLTGITVTATYSDGSTSNVIGYTLSGEILEGNNTITVSYGGKTTTFRVVGIAESSGDAEPIYAFENTENSVFYDRYTNMSYSAYLTISDGNHVKVTSETGSTTLFLDVNMSSFATNGQKASDITDTWFTIPAETTVKFCLKNLSYVQATRMYVSLLNANGEHINEDTDVIKNSVLLADEFEVIIDSDEDVTSVAFTAAFNANSLLEFDFELYVNGERWI